MDRKIDIHTHILPGIDDGATNVEESMEIIHYLYNQGITDIVLTSHYIENTKYSYNQVSRNQILTVLRNNLNNDKTFSCVEVTKALRALRRGLNH